MSHVKELSAYIARRLPGYYTRSNHAKALLDFWRVVKRNNIGKNCRHRPHPNSGIADLVSHYNWFKEIGR